MTSLGVWWGTERIGVLEQPDERSREYTFRYTNAHRPVSLSLPVREEPFSTFESAAFFEALLPEGPLRERLSRQLKVAANDSFGLLSEIGRDCAGALQILKGDRKPESPSVRWLDDDELSGLVASLPQHPLGIDSGDRRTRLSLAGVQNKAVLVRDRDSRFGRSVGGMASTHILKPEPANGAYPGLAANEFFCMRLAERCGLPAARVELESIGAAPCLIVERYDRDRSDWPPKRTHQEDLCQALGIPPALKYQQPDQRLPSFAALASLLNTYGAAPGLERLNAGNAAVFHFLVGNADAHAKNVSLVHGPNGVALAPLYDVVSTAAYPELDTSLAISVGDVFEPDRIGPTQWSDFAADLGLSPGLFARARVALATRMIGVASTLRAEAVAQKWHRPCIDSIVETIESRASQVTG